MDGSVDVDPGDPVTGVGTPNCEAELYIDGVFVGRVPIDPSGRWFYQPPLPWTAGRHCARAILRCAGDTSAFPPEDTTCFEVPGIVITGPEDGGSTDPEDPVTGTGEPECEAEIFVDGVSVGRVPIDQFGNWIYNPDPYWTQGEHCVTAVLRCPDDMRPDPPQDTTCFDVVYPACPPPPIDMPELNEVIASSRPSIAGRGIPYSQVQVCVRNSLNATVFCETTQLFADGEWGVQSPQDLPDGTYTVVATQLGGPCLPTSDSSAFSIFTINTDGLNVNLISLTRGPTFRTVDMVMSGASSPDTTLSIYYLLLTPGQPIPTEAEVVGYNDAAALTTGNAVRGQFTRTLVGAPTNFPFTLTGKENIASLPLETGVMDGFNYDIYVVGVTTSGHSTGVLTLFQSAVGMPFASGNGVAIDPFFVRMCTPAEMSFYPDLTGGNPGNRAGVTENARILDNIEGMQALYDQTGGVHGMPDSLSLAYNMDAAFDLANYAPAWDGNGWRPIGNVDAALSGAPLSGPHIFTGTAQTAPSGTTVSNLRINATAAPANPVLVRGLFGQTQNVTLSMFTLPDPAVFASVTGSTSGTQTAKIGALVGYAVGGQITAITIGTVSVTAGRAAAGSNTVYAGGLVGVAQGVTIVSSVTVSSAALTEATAQATVMGGLIGQLNQAGVSSSLIGVQEGQVSLNAYQTLGGVVGEISNGISHMDTISVNNVTLTHTGFRVGGIIGTLIANSASTLQNMTVGQIQMGPTNPPTTAGYAGGLIGNITQTAPCTVQDCEVNAGLIYSGGRVGGAFGSLNVSAAGFVIRNVGTAADTRPNNGPAGGFIGRIDINTAIASALLVDSCRVTAATLTVTSTNTSSAFVGGFVGFLSPGSGASGATTLVLAFVDCATSAAVSHPYGTNTGGFVGSAALSSYLRCRATGGVTARQNVGGFCGNGAGNSVITEPSLSSLQFTLCQARGNTASTDTALIANVATGGFAGALAYALIDRCFATGNAATARDDNVAGLVAQSAHRLAVLDSYAVGTVASPSDTAGGLVGSGVGTRIERCYAAGPVSTGTGAGGLVAVLNNDGSETGRLSASFALNPSVAAASAGGRAHRVCATLGAGAQLASNYALNTMTLTAGGTPVVPVSNPNGLDGQDMAQSDLSALLTVQGFDTTNVWDTSTIATLGRPTLMGNPE